MSHWDDARRLIRKARESLWVKAESDEPLSFWNPAAMDDAIMLLIRARTLMGQGAAEEGRPLDTEGRSK